MLCYNFTSVLSQRLHFNASKMTIISANVGRSAGSFFIQLRRRSLKAGGHLFQSKSVFKHEQGYPYKHKQRPRS